MPDREKVIAWLADEELYYREHGDTHNSLMACDALALLKSQDETINDLTDTIRQLNQHIKDLSEYMTPYGKVKDVKAYVELLKEQDNCENCAIAIEDRQQVVRCKDCKHYHKGFNCDLLQKPIMKGDEWFCADGERK